MGYCLDLSLNCSRYNLLSCLSKPSLLSPLLLGPGTLVTWGRRKFWKTVFSFAGQQQQFHAFAFGQRSFLSGHFGNPLDPLQRATDPLTFRMPSMSNCQSKYFECFFLSFTLFLICYLWHDWNSHFAVVLLAVWPFLRFGIISIQYVFYSFATMTYKKSSFFTWRLSKRP